MRLRPDKRYFKNVNQTFGAHYAERTPGLSYSALARIYSAKPGFCPTRNHVYTNARMIKGHFRGLRKSRLRRTREAGLFVCFLPRTNIDCLLRRHCISHVGAPSARWKSASLSGAFISSSAEKAACSASESGGRDVMRKPCVYNYTSQETEAAKRKEKATTILYVGINGHLFTSSVLKKQA